MILSNEERESALWKKLAEHINEQIDRAQRENEKFSLTPDETAAIRGKIKILRQLLKLGSGQDQPISQS